MIPFDVEQDPLASSEPDYGDELDGEFEQAVLEAFPDFAPEQVSALKAAIEACVEAKGSGGKSKGKAPKSGGLAAIFGKGGK